MPNTDDRDILGCVEQLLKVEPSEESIERAQERVRLLLTNKNSSRPSSSSREWRFARGLMSGLVAATVVASLAWAIVPAPFVAYSELLIRPVAPKLLWKRASDRLQFETYKTTQMKLIKSPFVLAAALRDPRLTGQARLAMGQDPVTWLSDHIRVTSPISEFIHIELRGAKPDLLAACVDAVTTAYLEEVVFAGKKMQQKRLAELEVVRRGLDEQLRVKQNLLKRMAETLGTDQPQTLTLKQQAILQFYAELRKQAAQISFELTRAKIKLAVITAGPKPEVKIEIPDSVLDLHVANEPQFQELSARIAHLETHFEQLKRIGTETSPKLEAAERKLTEARASLELLRNKLQPAIRERLITELTARSEAVDVNAETTLREQISSLEIQKQHYQDELEKQKVEQKRTGILSFELATIRSEIGQKQAVAKTVGDEISRLEIELATPRQISLFQSATGEKSQRDHRQQIIAASLSGLVAFLIATGWLWRRQGTGRWGVR